MRRAGFIFRALFVLAVLAWAVPSAAGWKPGKQSSQRGDGPREDTAVASTMDAFLEQDPSMKSFFEEAYGYAVFPTVGKGGIVVGGAHGRGKVYEKGKLVGLTSLTQVTVGFQLGGQGYSQIIFFRDKKALGDFTEGNFELSAQASAVLATLGAAKTADYDNGVAIFIHSKGGLMYEASVGGQKFGFDPL